MKILIAVLMMIATINAIGATDLASVEKLDKSREGALQAEVLKYFASNFKTDCGELTLTKTDILKIKSYSSNREKVPGTPYDYAAIYLVTQKCLSGSTFQGAALDEGISVAIKAEFTSKYNSANGPKKMEELKIEKVQDLTFPDLFSAPDDV